MAANATLPDGGRNSRRIGDIPTPTWRERVGDGWYRQCREIERWAGPYGWITILLIPPAVLMLLWLRGVFGG